MQERKGFLSVDLLRFGCQKQLGEVHVECLEDVLPLRQGHLLEAFLQLCQNAKPLPPTAQTSRPQRSSYVFMNHA